MTRALVAAALLLTLIPGGAGAGSAREGTARLKIMAAAPLSIRGTGFHAGEVVRITVVADGTTTKRAVANDGGAFLSRFRVAFDRCQGLIARAVGDMGSRAGLRTPRLMCPPRL